MSITDALPNLSAPVAHHTVRTLLAGLPPPLTDSPDVLADRDEAAVAAIAAFHPVDALEARLASQIVTFDASAQECLRLAFLPGQDPGAASRYRSQATTMARQSQATLRQFNRDRAAREKAEAERNPAAMERAGYWFKDVSVPAPEDAPRSINPEALTGIAAEADLYAVLHPQRATEMRARGDLPQPCSYGPPRPELLHAIITGTTPNLLALDTASTA